MRGIGLSEPVERLPTLEEQDIATVMNTVGLDRALVYGRAPPRLARSCSPPCTRTASTGWC